MQLIKPPHLRSGDAVAVVSPSWGGPAAFPDRFDRGLARLAELGLRPVVMTAARGTRRWMSGTIRERVGDLHDAFADPSFRGVIASIGGAHSAQLLASLDFDLIRRNPKVFCGYSDITSLHHAIHAMTGLVTFYGPAVMPEFGEWPEPDAYTIDYFRRALMQTEPVGEVSTPPYSVHEHRDWGLEPVMRRRDAAEPLVALRDGIARGPSLVACLPSARHLLGTPWQPSYDGRILILETPEQPYRPSDADRDLWHVRNAGLLAGLRGLVIGRPKEFSAEDVAEFHEVVRDVVSDYSYPVLLNAPVGHVTPIATIPIGVEVEITGSTFVIVESGVC